MLAPDSPIIPVTPLPEQSQYTSGGTYPVYVTGGTLAFGFTGSINFSGGSIPVQVINAVTIASMPPVAVSSVSGTVAVRMTEEPIEVTGTVATNVNIPGTLPVEITGEPVEVTGTVAVTGLTLSGTQNVHVLDPVSIAGTVPVDFTRPVEVTGTVVTNVSIPGTQPVQITGEPVEVTGTVAVTGLTLSGTQDVRVLDPVSIAGTVPVSFDRPVEVTGTVVTNVTIPGTQPVEITGQPVWVRTSGTTLVDFSRPVEVSGTISVSNDIEFGTVAISTDPLNVVQSGTSSVIIREQPITVQISSIPLGVQQVGTADVRLVDQPVQVTGNVGISGTVPVDFARPIEVSGTVSVSNDIEFGTVAISTDPLNVVQSGTSSVVIRGQPVETTLTGPVTIAGTVPVSATWTPTGTQDVQITGQPVEVTGTVVTSYTIPGTIAVSLVEQPIQTTVTNPVTIDGTIPVSGNFTITPTGTQDVRIVEQPIAVTGTVVTNVSIPGTQSVEIVGQPVQTTILGTVPVDFARPVEVSGTVSVSNDIEFGTIAISTDPLNVQQVGTSSVVIREQPVAVTGDVTVSSGVSINGTVPVAFDQPVAVSLAGTTVVDFDRPVEVTGTVVTNVSIPGTQSVEIIGQPIQTAIVGAVSVAGTVPVDFTRPVEVSGTVSVSNDIQFGTIAISTDPLNVQQVGTASVVIREQPLAVTGDVTVSAGVSIVGTVPVAFDQPVAVSVAGTQIVDFTRPVEVSVPGTLAVSLIEQPIQTTVVNSVSVNGTVPVEFTRPVEISGTVSVSNDIEFGTVAISTDPLNVQQVGTVSVVVREQPVAVTGDVTVSSGVSIVGTVPVAFDQPVSVSLAGTAIVDFDRPVEVTVPGTVAVSLVEQPIQTTLVNAVNVNGTVPVDFTRPVEVTGTISVSNDIEFGTVAISTSPLNVVQSGTVEVVIREQPVEVQGNVTASIAGTVPVVLTEQPVTVQGVVSLAGTTPVSLPEQPIQVTVVNPTSTVSIAGTVPVAFDQPVAVSVAGTAIVDFNRPVEVTGSTSIVGTVPVSLVEQPIQATVVNALSISGTVPVDFTRPVEVSGTISVSNDIEFGTVAISTDPLNVIGSVSLTGTSTVEVVGQPLAVNVNNVPTVSINGTVPVAFDQPISVSVAGTAIVDFDRPVDVQGTVNVAGTVPVSLGEQPIQTTVVNTVPVSFAQPVTVSGTVAVSNDIEFGTIAISTDPLNVQQVGTASVVIREQPVTVTGDVTVSSGVSINGTVPVAFDQPVTVSVAGTTVVDFDRPVDVNVQGTIPVSLPEQPIQTTVVNGITLVGTVPVDFTRPVEVTGTISVSNDIEFGTVAISTDPLNVVGSVSLTGTSAVEVVGQPIAVNVSNAPTVNINGTVPVAFDQPVSVSVAGTAIVDFNRPVEVTGNVGATISGTVPVEVVNGAVTVVNVPTVNISGTVPVAFDQPIAVTVAGTAIVDFDRPVEVTGNVGATISGTVPVEVVNGAVTVVNTPTVNINGTVPVAFDQPIAVSGTVVTTPDPIPYGVSSSGTNRYNYATSNIVKNASATYDSYLINDGLTGHLLSITMARSRDTRFDVQVVQNGVATTVASLLNSAANVRTLEFKPPHQELFTLLGNAGQIDLWRVVATDLNDDPANAYVTFQWFEV